MNRISYLLSAAGGLALATVGASPAFAAGTAAGTSVTNTVSVGYSVGGVSQTAVTAADTFTVDRKVNLTVAEGGTATTTVSPGQLAAVDAFTVTNTSNAVLDFALTAAQQTGGAGAHSNTDNFDATNVRVYVDALGTGAGTFGPEDVLASSIDELAADSSRTVFVVSDIPLGRATGDVAVVTLTAAAREGGAAGTLGAAITQTTGANTSGVDTVFADAAGATDAARDGAFSAKDDYTVLTALLSVLKSSRVISDPINLTTNPKLIPGATVEYCIAVTNAVGGVTATTVGISDTLPSATTYLSSFGILVNGTVTGSACNADGSAGGLQSAGVITATLPSLAAGATKTVVFRVTVN